MIIVTTIDTAVRFCVRLSLDAKETIDVLGHKHVDQSQYPPERRVASNLLPEIDATIAREQLYGVSGELGAWRALELPSLGVSIDNRSLLQRELRFSWAKIRLVQQFVHFYRGHAAGKFRFSETAISEREAIQICWRDREQTSKIKPCLPTRRDGSTRARLCCCCFAARSEPRTRRRNKLKRTRRRRRRRLQPTPTTTKRTRLASSGTSLINIIRRLGYYDPASVLARRLLADETMAKKAQLLRSFQQQHSSRGTKKNDYDEDAPPADYYYTVAGGGGDLPVEFRSVDEVLDDLAKQRLSKIAYSSSGQPRGGKKPLLGYGQLIGGGSSYDDLSFNALDSNSASSSNNEDEYQQKRAYAQGFHSVRGRRSGPSYYYANGNLLDQLDEFEKRALLSGFQSMRGKKDLVLEDLPLELGRYVAAKRRMLGFHGMRGKRSLAPNLLDLNVAANEFTKAFVATTTKRNG
uniref:Neuropeptide-like 1 n=1 Tax=Trichogramma kaykai TaxID=54128 RepID=A0ABD2VY13_9HYME